MGYYVVDWEKHFEKQRKDRPNARFTWVGIPNKHDGKGYRRLMRRPNGPLVFAAWILILQVASKCPTRGRLVDADGPLSADDLEMKTDCPADVFAQAFPILMEIGWLGELSDACLPPIGHKSDAVGQPSDHITVHEHDITDITDITEPEKFEEVVNSDSDSKPPQVLFGLSRAQGYIRWTAALTPLIGMDDGSRHPPQSKKYNADMTCMGRWFDQYVWPEDVADLVGRSNLAVAVERAAAAQRSGKNPMAYLGGMIKDVFSDEGMSLPDH